MKRLKKKPLKKGAKKSPKLPFTEFVLRLCTNPKALERFKKNPEAAAKAAKLTLKQKSALKSKDSDQINKELIRENPFCAFPNGIRNILCRGVDFHWTVRKRK